MCQFIESIKIENHEVFLLNMHQKRVLETFSYFRKKCYLDLNKIIQDIKYDGKGLYKLRIVYDLQQNYEVQIIPYTIPEIKSFELVENNSISYDFKYLNRANLEDLKKSVEAQEIIIVKNGCVTDTSFSNLLFFKDKTWYTSKSYLLNGVQRRNLLLKDNIKELEIHINKLKSFSHFRIINAMNDLNSPLIYPMEKIINLLD